jgi:hypothetical protein
MAVNLLRITRQRDIPFHPERRLHGHHRSWPDRVVSGLGQNPPAAAGHPEPCFLCILDGRHEHLRRDSGGFRIPDAAAFGGTARLRSRSSATSGNLFLLPGFEEGRGFRGGGGDGRLLTAGNRPDRRRAAGKTHVPRGLSRVRADHPGRVRDVLHRTIRNAQTAAARAVGFGIVRRGKRDAENGVQPNEFRHGLRLLYARYVRRVAVSAGPKIVEGTDLGKLGRGHAEQPLLVFREPVYFGCRLIRDLLRD